MSTLSFDYLYIDTVNGSRRYLVQMTDPDLDPAAQVFHVSNIPEVDDATALENMKPDLLWTYRRSHPDGDEVVLTENLALELPA